MAIILSLLVWLLKILVLFLYLWIFKQNLNLITKYILFPKKARNLEVSNSHHPSLILYDDVVQCFHSTLLLYCLLRRLLSFYSHFSFLILTNFIAPIFFLSHSFIQDPFSLFIKSFVISWSEGQLATYSDPLKVSLFLPQFT